MALHQAKGNTMAKGNTTQTPAPAPAGTMLYGHPANGILTVTLPQGYKLPKAGTARAQWLARLQAHNGKTLAAFVASVQASHPSVPTKGKLAGKLEPVGGWLSAFTGNKLGRILTITAPK